MLKITYIPLDVFSLVCECVAVSAPISLIINIQIRPIPNISVSPEIFNIFIEKCRNNVTFSEYARVVKMLVEFHARYSFRKYT